jgi:GT2 family glycosyltransferase
VRVNIEMNLSIIIVSWNAKNYLKSCLESIEKQISYETTEIIVVDNNSSDGSADLVRKYFRQVIIIENCKNLGFAKANNIGISACNGKYICLINSDVIVLASCFSKMLEFMNNNSGVGVSGPRTFNVDGTLQRSCFSYPSVWNIFCRALALDSLFPKSKLFGKRLMTFWDHDTVKSVEALNGCFLMVRKEAIDKVGLLDEDFFFYGEDLDWCKRFNDAGWEVVFFPEAMAIHYGGASSSNSPIRFYIEMHRADMQYWKKHRGRFGVIVYVVITFIHHVIRIFGMATVYVMRPRKRIEVKGKIKRSSACIKWFFNYVRGVLFEAF